MDRTHYYNIASIWKYQPFLGDLHQEIFQKKLTALSINIDWQPTDTTLAGLLAQQEIDIQNANNLLRISAQQEFIGDSAQRFLNEDSFMAPEMMMLNTAASASSNISSALP